MILGGIDIETTGLKQEDGHRIIEICAVLYHYDLATGQIRHLTTYNKRIHPERMIDPAAEKVHHISLSDLEGAPVWTEVVDMIVKILDKVDLAIGHNGDWFDFPFIAMEIMRVGKTVPSFGTFDTMSNGRWATPNGKNPNLRELCFACDIPYDPALAHAAEYDVYRMMDCLFVGMNKGFYTLPTLQEVA